MFIGLPSYNNRNKQDFLGTFWIKSLSKNPEMFFPPNILLFPI